jgi:hypothetical protein
MLTALGVFDDDQALEKDNLWFTNLLLLGFDPINLEKKHRIVFNKDMFKNANVQGMEIVFHFLFNRLDPKKTEKEFMGAWPVYGKGRRTTFRNKVASWLKSLREERKIHMLTLQNTVLQTCYGENFCHILLELSTYALRCCLHNEFPKYVNEELPFCARDEFLAGFWEEDLPHSKNTLSDVKMKQNCMMVICPLICFLIKLSFTFVQELESL